MQLGIPTYIIRGDTELSIKYNIKTNVDVLISKDDSESKILHNNGRQVTILYVIASYGLCFLAVLVICDSRTPFIYSHYLRM